MTYPPKPILNGTGADGGNDRSAQAQAEMAVGEKPWNPVANCPPPNNPDRFVKAGPLADDGEKPNPNCCWPIS